LDIQIQPGDEIQGVKINSSNSPIYFNKIYNDIVRILWYASDGIPLNLQPDETLLWVDIRRSNSNTPSSELKLIGYNEINNGWVQPYQNFRLQAPRLNARKNGNTDQITLYPNPVNEGVLNIDFSATQNHSGTIQITDILGKVIYSTNVDMANTPDKVLRIQTNSWNKGQYHFLLHGKTHDDKPFQMKKAFTIH